MKIRFAAFALLTIVTGGIAVATVQRVSHPGSLDLEGWELVELDGRPVLMSPEVRWYEKENLGLKPLGGWNVSAPTMISKNGLRLAVSGEDSSEIQLTKDKPKAPDWTFEVTEVVNPQAIKTIVDRRKTSFRTGIEGYRFRIRVGDGPRRGWYLAPGATFTKKAPVGEREFELRRLTLVEDLKSAGVFTFTKSSYSVN